MRRVTLVVGLPGSGKSHWARTQAAGEGVPFLDDPRSSSELEEALTSGESLYIADPMLCLPERRESAVRFLQRVAPDAELRWVYFANDVQACRENLARRDASGDIRDVEPTLRILTRKYEIPKDALVYPVWNPTLQQRVRSR